MKSGIACSKDGLSETQPPELQKGERDMSFHLNASPDARKAQEEWPRHRPKPREPMTRERAVELIASEGDDEKAHKRRTAGWYGLIKTTIEDDDWLDVVRRIGANFGVVPRGAVEEFMKRRPSGIYEEALESAILMEAGKRLHDAQPESNERWEKSDLRLAYRIVEFFGGDDPRVKRFFQDLVDAEKPEFPRELRERVEIRWELSGFGKNPPKFLNTGKPAGARATKKKQERSQRDRELRQRMRGSAGSGGKKGK